MECYVYLQIQEVLLVEVVSNLMECNVMILRQINGFGDCDLDLTKIIIFENLFE